MWRLIKDMSLIEWLIVLAIIGIIAVIIVPVIRGTSTSSYVGGRLIYTDPDTHCQYYEQPGQPMTPRLGSDGRPICTPEKRP